MRASRMSLPFHVYTCDWEGKCWLPWPHVTQVVHDALSKRRQAQVISMYQAITRMQDVPAKECHVRLEKLQQERGLSIKQLYVEAVSFLKYRIQLLVMCRAPLLHAQRQGARGQSAHRSVVIFSCERVAAAVSLFLKAALSAAEPVGRHIGAQRCVPLSV